MSVDDCPATTASPRAMPCPNTNPIFSQLSYSLVSFTRTAFDDPAQEVRQLADLGFGILTIVPTWRVQTQPLPVTYDSAGTQKPHRRLVAIDTTVTPSVDAIEALMREAIHRGLHVRLEPHLDADVVLDAGVGETFWRARLLFDPIAALLQPASYFDVVLTPLMDAMIAVKDEHVLNMPECKACFSLTLGSELELSTIAYPNQWKAALDRLKTRRRDAQLDRRLDFGHKLNFDHPQRFRSWVGEINQLRPHVDPNLPAIDSAAQPGRVAGYLSALDYIGFSFYPNVSGALSASEWRGDPSTEKTKRIADAFAAAWASLEAPFAGLNVPLEISEAGLGSSDTSRPWNSDDARSLATDEGKKVRRNYYGRVRPSGGCGCQHRL